MFSTIEKSKIQEIISLDYVNTIEGIMKLLTTLFRVEKNEGEIPRAKIMKKNIKDSIKRKTIDDFLEYCRKKNQNDQLKGHSASRVYQNSGSKKPENYYKHTREIEKFRRQLISLIENQEKEERLSKLINLIESSYLQTTLHEIYQISRNRQEKILMPLIYKCRSLINFYPYGEKEEKKKILEKIGEYLDKTKGNTNEEIKEIIEEILHIIKGEDEEAISTIKNTLLTIEGLIKKSNNKHSQVSESEVHSHVY